MVNQCPDVVIRTGIRHIDGLDSQSQHGSFKLGDIGGIGGLCRATCLALEKSGEIIDVQLLERACLACFRLAEPCEISAYAECDGGVAERICLAAKESSDLDEFWNAVKTKRYTDAKLRRAMLFALTRVDRELLMRAPEYTFLLAANERGRELLSVNKKVYSGTGNGVKIITKPADAPRDTRQFAVEERLNSLFMLAQKKAFPTGEAYRKNAFIIK